MSRFEGNPFEEDTSNNPYADSGGGYSKSSRAAPPPEAGMFFDNVGDYSTKPTAPTSSFNSGAETVPSIRIAPLPPESRAGSAFDGARDTPFSPKSLKRKQRELQAKEAELRRKEQELNQREESLGIYRPNWPPFFPIIRHNIAEDIPAHLQSMQRVAFFSWMGAISCLLYSVVAVIVAWASGATYFTSGMFGFFMAGIILLLGVPLSYYFWYRRLYNSLKNDSSFGLVFFFISYTSHILWFILFAIAPPIFFGGVFMTGVLTTLGFFGSGNWVVGIIYAVGTCLFGCEVMLSIVVLGQVFAYFRGSGKANQLRQEAAMAALRNAV